MLTATVQCMITCFIENVRDLPDNELRSLQVFACVDSNYMITCFIENGLRSLQVFPCVERQSTTYDNLFDGEWVEIY